MNECVFIFGHCRFACAWETKSAAVQKIPYMAPSINQRCAKAQKKGRWKEAVNGPLGRPMGHVFPNADGDFIQGPEKDSKG